MSAPSVYGVTVLEGVDRFPDDGVHEQAAACDAAMELRRDQAWLLSHDRKLLSEAFQEIIDLVGRDQKGAHQHHRAAIVLELLLGRRRAHGRRCL
jgi:hypothetical protein